MLSFIERTKGKVSCVAFNCTVPYRVMLYSVVLLPSTMGPMGSPDPKDQPGAMEKVPSPPGPIPPEMPPISESLMLQW